MNDVERIGVADLFRIGIGPSSSHTVGPMFAAKRFAARLADRDVLDQVALLRVDLYGSLAATGRGHGTLGAVLMGLEGRAPETIDLAERDQRLAQIAGGDLLLLNRSHAVAFAADDIVMHPFTRLPGHANGMCFAAEDANGHTLLRLVGYSIGGGAVQWEDPREAGVTTGAESTQDDRGSRDRIHTPNDRYDFHSGAQLLAMCEGGASVSGVMRRLENARGAADVELDERIDRALGVMRDCVESGFSATGVLPGGLNVPRRAAQVRQQLEAAGGYTRELETEWLAAAAMAVSEQNAAGARVVTAPTNGAAGILPSVLFWLEHFSEVPAVELPERRRRLILAATAIGVLCRRRASISGAEVGCQGEVGSACAMAAGGLVDALGGTAEQVENAAEIAIEHHLGLTCDPVGGLVQIPCIERNAVAANTAVVAARLALRGDGSHRVTLDEVLDTMRRTGADMSEKYKETSRGGLAVSVIEC